MVPFSHALGSPPAGKRGEGHGGTSRVRLLLLRSEGRVVHLLPHPQVVSRVGPVEKVWLTRFPFGIIKPRGEIVMMGQKTAQMELLMYHPEELISTGHLLKQVGRLVTFEFVL